MAIVRMRACVVLVVALVICDMIGPALSDRPQLFRGSDAGHAMSNGRVLLVGGDSQDNPDPDPSDLDEDDGADSTGSGVSGTGSGGDDAINAVAEPTEKLGVTLGEQVTSESPQRDEASKSLPKTDESQSHMPLMARVFRLDAEFGALRVSVANLEVQLGMHRSGAAEKKATISSDSSAAGSPTGKAVLGEIQQAVVTQHDSSEDEPAAGSKELDAISEARKHALEDLATRVKEQRSVIDGLKERQAAIEKYLSTQLAGSVDVNEDTAQGAKNGGVEGDVEGLELSVTKLWDRINGVNKVVYGRSAAQLYVPARASS